MALLTPQEVAAWVPQATEREGLLLDAVSMAVGLADEFCGRHLELTDYDVVMDVAPGLVSLLMPEYPLVVDDDHALTITDDPDGAATVLDASWYVAVAGAGMIKRVDGGTWPAGYRSLRVQYSAGYTSLTLPAGLRRTLLQLVAWVLESAGNVGAQSESHDGYSVTYEQTTNGLPQSIANALRPYKAGTLA
ncbi:MAG: hypothetical protein GYA36_23010 [Veillonellaceae bacterium]|nr:hypothetical protein [Veillonellaceae bacterium]